MIWVSASLPLLDPCAVVVAAVHPRLEQGRADRVVVARARGEKGEPADGAQQTGCLVQLDLGIDPVECGRGDHQIESAVVPLEVLEGDDSETDGRPTQPPTGNGDHRRPDIDGGHIAAVPRELLGQLTGPAADLEHPAAFPERRGRDHELDELAGIPTP